MSGKFRGQTVWDPTLIVFQILTVLFLSYASLSILVFMAANLSGYAPSTIFIFDHRIMRLGTAKMIILAHLANSLAGAYLLRTFVGRSKSCLDFAITHYVIHFIIVWYCTNTVPDTFLWYFINFLGVCFMCIGGEYLCRKDEMVSIKLMPVVMETERENFG